MSEFHETVVRIESLLGTLTPPQRRNVCLKLLLTRFYLEDNPERETVLYLLASLSEPADDRSVRERLQAMFEVVCAAWLAIAENLPLTAFGDYPCSGEVLQHAWALLVPVDIPPSAPQIAADVCFASERRNRRRNC